jgi:hypothetical protein
VAGGARPLCNRKERPGAAWAREACQGFAGRRGGKPLQATQPQQRQWCFPSPNVKFFLHTEHSARVRARGVSQDTASEPQPRAR